MTKPLAHPYILGRLPLWPPPRYYTERMSIAQIWQTESSNLEDTLQLAEQIGRRLKGGEVIELISDLGGGKTSFVRGLAKGLGSNDIVHSPSFTISNQYQAGKLTLHHLDFYRLDEPGLIKDEVAEILTNPNNIVVVEWAGIIKDILPTHCLSIYIKPTGETARSLTFEYPKTLKYLIPNS